MKRIVTLVFLVTLFYCKGQDHVSERAAFVSEHSDTQKFNPKNVIKEGEITLKIYDFDNFESFLNKKDNKIYIINFWATWCKPCVAELPNFEKISENYQDSNVEVILVSLDLPRMFRSHLIPFIKREDLKSEVIVLDDPRQNNWIPRVNEEWSGAIPATVIYNKNKRAFFEQSFDYVTLEKALKQFLK